MAEAGKAEPWGDGVNAEFEVNISLIKGWGLAEARKILIGRAVDSYWKKPPGVENYQVALAEGEPLATLVFSEYLVDPVSGLTGSAFVDFTADAHGFLLVMAIPLPRKTSYEEVEERLVDLARSFDFEVLNIRRTRGVLGDHDNGFEIKFYAPILGATLEGVASKAKQIFTMAISYDGSIPNIAAIMRLFRNNSPDVFLGMSESEYLEFKGPPYELRKDSPWKHLLCDDIARFANSEHGGLIAIGFATKKISGTDVAIKVAPVPVNAKRHQSYQQVADQYIYPPVEGLRFESFSVSDGEVCCIIVPTQREMNKPYMVQGALADGEYRGGMISIPRRRGEDSIPITAREIHRMISAGRSFLMNSSFSGFEDTGG
ncbi:AlbA family DNA-binding domain-containing protein [Nocardiopsis alborubida]|uniref:ATP-binding protein n=1 Tax=Nocardiopsis alborubida TaxID=146802 RepID=A0A7X6M9P3_9ACTN|nr:ATP-binding protein [Nocardiopsis alborubida]NKY96073.1 ATP-binding protein [Nocardiopsis alborubida]